MGGITTVPPAFSTRATTSSTSSTLTYDAHHTGPGCGWSARPATTFPSMVAIE